MPDNVPGTRGIAMVKGDVVPIPKEPMQQQARQILKNNFTHSIVFWWGGQS